MEPEKDDLIGYLVRLNCGSNAYTVTGYATYAHCADKYLLEAEDSTGRPITGWYERGEFVRLA